MQILYWALAGIAAIFILWILITKIIGVRVISSNEVAVIEKWWSPRGSLTNSLIALHGEAGYLPNLLRGGIHLRSALMYKIHKYPLITIPQGQIGYLFARDGEPLKPNQTLGKIVEQAENFQNVRGFLENGGQRGPQRGILREGTYAINLAAFIVVLSTNILSISNTEGERNEIQGMQKTIQSRNGFSPVVIMSGGNATQRAADAGDDDSDTQSRKMPQKAASAYSMSSRGSVTDVLGIATVHDGDPIENGEIIAPDIGNIHSNFQDPEAFLANGGKRGKQLRVLTDGTYYLNCLFVTIEIRPKTFIPIGYVGVVTAFYGSTGEDISGDSFSHGRLVKAGCKGVQEEPLYPGKYAINTDACSVSLVPITNVVLKWSANETGGNNYDTGLAEVGIITKDAFEPQLPLSVVMHIDSKDAPMVIQRFGDLNRLVNQSLDPLVSAYFKDIAQTKTLIELIQSRSEIRERSIVDMKLRFEKYNLKLEEVLIGTPISANGDKQIENILMQLRDRQIAEEQKVTFGKQKESADAEKSLREAQAIAENQTHLTQSKINIEVAENEGEAEARKAKQQAVQIKALAEANANKIELEGKAEASKEENIGIAKAVAIKKQVDAYGDPKLRMAQEIADKISVAIRDAKVSTVPNTLINMSGQNSTKSLMDLLMTTMTMAGINKAELSETAVVEEPKE